MSKMKELFMQQREMEMQSTIDYIYMNQQDVEFYWDSLTIQELQSLLPSPFEYFINKRIKELREKC